MKKLAGLLAAIGLVLALASPASAAPTVGSSCKMSANWTVNMSATWYGAELSYVVITSPGPLFYGTAAAVQTEAHAWVGNDEHYVRDFGRIGTGTNPYTYRANFTNTPNATLAGAYAESYPNHVVCWAEMRHP